MNTTPGSGNRAHSRAQFTRLLDRLGIDSEERISICDLKAGDRFQSLVPKNRDMAERFAFTPQIMECDVWFGVNPVQVPQGYSGRGTDDHVTRCTALFADIDIKAGGVPNQDLADTVTRGISTALGTDPTAVVLTGHGGHAYWVLDPHDSAWVLDTAEKRAAVKALYERFHRLCADVATRHGCGIDKVSQPSRILRVPGTYNRKDPDQPIAVTLIEDPYGTSTPLGYDAVLTALDTAGVADVHDAGPRDRTVVSDPEDWQFGEQTTPYVTAMITGWGTDIPRAGVTRHNWLVCQATRLACAHRLGHITASDFENAVGALEQAFDRLLATAGDPRRATPDEFANALQWGAQRTATLTGDEVATALGGADGHTGADATSLDPAGPSDGKPKVRRGSAMRAPEPMKWLAKGNIPKSAVTLLVGDEGIGKSTYWVWLAAHVTTGRPCPDYGLPERDPHDVILVVTEDDWSSAVSPRLRVAGVDFDRIHIVSVEDDGSGSPTFPDHMDVLTTVEKTPALVVVDAWLDTVPSRLSVKDPQQARQALHPWKEYATATGAAVLLLTHTNRVSTANPRDKYGATAELRKTARQTLFALADPDADDCLIVGSEKSNNVARGSEATRFRITPVQFTAPTVDSDGIVTKIEYCGPVGKSTRDLIAEIHHGTDDDGEIDKLTEAVYWLEDYLTETTPSKVVKTDAKAVGITARTLERAAKKLNVSASSAGFPRMTHWTPTGGIEMTAELLDAHSSPAREV